MMTMGECDGFLWIHEGWKGRFVHGIGAGIGYGRQRHLQDGLNMLYGVETGRCMLHWGPSILAALLYTFVTIITTAM